MSRWFRVYDDLVDDPKVQLLTPELFKTWINLLAMASRNGGILPPVASLAFSLRISPQDMQARLDELILAGLIDIRRDGNLEPHNWAKRQWKSDDSKDRVRKHRAAKRACNDDVTVTVTPPEPEADTETEAEQIPREGAKAGLKILIDGLARQGGRQGVSDRLQRRAEGLGLPVSEFCRRCSAPDVRKPNGMFKRLCADHLAEKLPRANRAMLGAVFDNDAAHATVMQLLCEVP